MTIPAIKFKRLHPAAILPTRAHSTDAGLDLYALGVVEYYVNGLPLPHSVDDPYPLRVQPGHRVFVSTGWAIEIPDGFEAQVRPRSGLALKHGITVLNSPGTIDASYRGEINVILVNHNQHGSFKISRGDRIAQLVVAPVTLATPVEVAELSDTDRGAGGCGSTGR